MKSMMNCLNGKSGGTGSADAMSSRVRRGSALLKGSQITSLSVFFLIQMPPWHHLAQKEVFPGNKMMPLCALTSAESFSRHQVAETSVWIKFTLWEPCKFPGEFSIYSEVIAFDTPS